MDTAHLCRMANQIGQYYQSLPDRQEALSSTASHIRRFWDPRMRRALYTHLDEHEGAGLDPLALDAIRAHRATVEPPPLTAAGAGARGVSGSHF